MESLALYVVILLTGMVFGAEIVASHVTHSLVLLVSSYHMLYNLLSLLLLLISHRMSKQKTLKNTFGWVRLKVLGMMVNMLFLCALCFAACVECIQTVIHASHENTEPRLPFLLLTLGVIDFIVNIICFILIGGYTHHQGCSMIIQRNDVQVNCVISESIVTRTSSVDIQDTKDASLPKVSGAHKMMDLSRDTSTCLTVIACACIIILLNGLILKYVDAILSVAAVVVLLATTHPFIRESGLILLQSIPNNVNIDRLSARLCKEFPDIQNVHDLHVWRLTADEVIATVHIIFATPAIYNEIASKLNSFFEKEGISLVTIQPEFLKDSCSPNKGVCILPCSSNNNCGAMTCCGPIQERNASNLRLRCTDKEKIGEEATPCLANQKAAVLSSYSLDMNSFDFRKIDVATETIV